MFLFESEFLYIFYLQKIIKPLRSRCELNLVEKWKFVQVEKNLIVRIKLKPFVSDEYVFNYSCAKTYRQFKYVQWCRWGENLNPLVMLYYRDIIIWYYIRQI